MQTSQTAMPRPEVSEAFGVAARAAAESVTTLPPARYFSSAINGVPEPARGLAYAAAFALGSLLTNTKPHEYQFTKAVLRKELMKCSPELLSEVECDAMGTRETLRSLGDQSKLFRQVMEGGVN